MGQHPGQGIAFISLGIRAVETPESPLRKQFYTNNGTVEQMAELLEHGSGGMARAAGTIPLSTHYPCQKMLRRDDTNPSSNFHTQRGKVCTTPECTKFGEGGWDEGDLCPCASFLSRRRRKKRPKNQNCRRRRSSRSQKCAPPPHLGNQSTLQGGRMPTLGSQVRVAGRGRHTGIGCGARLGAPFALPRSPTSPSGAVGVGGFWWAEAGPVVGARAWGVAAGHGSG